MIICLILPVPESKYLVVKRVSRFSKALGVKQIEYHASFDDNAEVDVPISERIQNQEPSPEIVTLCRTKKKKKITIHKICIFWIHLLPAPKCFNLKYHGSAFPYLWSNLMVIGAITLISKLGKATLVRNAVISSLHHSLLTDRRALCLP